MNIAYCCFTDTKNIGDYALYKANESLFPEFSLFPGGEARQSRVNLFGGGTLYPYCVRYRWFPRRPINVALGQGVGVPNRSGKFGFLTRTAMWLTPFKWFGVRGPHSQEILRNHRIQSIVTGDTALIHQPVGNIQRIKGRIGICLVGEDMRRSGSPMQIKEVILRLARRLIADGNQIVLFPFCIHDIDCLREIGVELGKDTTLVDFWSDPIACNLRSFLEKLQECECIIGERLHSVVLAAAVGTPFVSLGYKRKCFDFVDSLNVDHPLIVDSRNADAGDIYARIENIRNEYDSVEQSVSSAVSRLRNEINRGADEIRGVIAKSNKCAV